MLYKPSISLLLATSVALSSALPIDINHYVESLGQKVLAASSVFKSHSKKPEDDVAKFSIASLIPQADYENWIGNESGYAFEAIIRNIGGYGQGIDDALPGTVIASPSRHNPNYYYQVSFLSFLSFLFVWRCPRWVTWWDLSLSHAPRRD